MPTHSTAQSLLVALSLSPMLCGTFAAAESLKIDFQDLAGDTLAGYRSYEATNQDLSSLKAVNYGGALPATVEITVANLPDTPHDFRVVDRGLVHPGDTDEVSDWIGVDARLGAPGSPIAGNPRPVLNVVVSNLADGFYTWSSLHHDTRGQTGRSSYVFTDATGSANGILDATGDQDTLDPTQFATFDRTFVSVGGDPVTLSLTPIEVDGTFDFTVFGSFSFINAMSITRVPEPGALAIVSVFLATAAFRRKR